MGDQFSPPCFVCSVPFLILGLCLYFILCEPPFYLDLFQLAPSPSNSPQAKRPKNGDSDGSRSAGRPGSPSAGGAVPSSSGGGGILEMAMQQIRPISFGPPGGHLISGRQTGAGVSDSGISPVSPASTPDPVQQSTGDDGEDSSSDAD